MTYQVQVQPDGPYWSIWVPAIKRATQAKKLKDVDTMAKELISIMTNEKSPAINVEMKLPRDVKEAQELKEEAEKASLEAQKSQKKSGEKTAPHENVLSRHRYASAHKLPARPTASHRLNKSLNLFQQNRLPRIPIASRTSG